MPASAAERPTVPVDFAIDMPDVLKSQLTGHAEMRLNGDVVMINGVNGRLGEGAFNGWASVDIASKPLVKLDLDFQRISLASGRFAMIDDGVGFQLVPWRQDLERHLGKEVAGKVNARGGVDWNFARSRGPAV